MVFFASIPGIVWIDAENEEKAAAEIECLLTDFLEY
jgi:hypothetical protein